jgi:septum formation topological specificity factor MinE
MIKLRTEELNNIIQVLSNISKKKLPSTIQFDLALLLDDIQSKQKVLEQTRINLLNTYAEKDENGELVFSDEEKTRVNIQKDKIEEFQKELLELFNQEVEFDFEPIKFSQIKEYYDRIKIDELPPVLDKENNIIESTINMNEYLVLRKIIVR